MIERAIIESIKKIAGRQLTDEVFLIPCEVESVDIGTRSCVCRTIGGEAESELPDVQLMTSVDDGFLLVPVVGSTVLVIHSKRHFPAIVLFSAIEQILIVTGDSTLMMKDGLAQFNDGGFGGLIKIEDLVKKLNNIENLLNNLITKFNSHTHTGVSAGGGTSGPTAATESNHLTPTTQDELENKLITHGK